MRQLAQFAVATVLARLLTPEDFGSIALLGLLVFFGTVTSELGLSTALLQSADVEREDFGVALSISLVSGVVTTAVAAGLAWPVATAFGLGHLAPVAAFMALAIGATTAGLVPTTILVRRAEFSRLLVTGLLAVLLGGGTAIAMARSGAGVWSLAVMTVVTPLVVTASAFALCRDRARPGWNRVRAVRLLSRGRWVLATNALDAAWIRVQYGVVGGVFGASALGLYQRAETTQQVANDATTIVVGRVALPVFARSAASPLLLRAGFRTGVGMTTAFVAPLMALMSALATPLVVTAFGDQWGPSGPVLSVLCLAGMVWPLHLMAHNVLYAAAQNRTVFLVNVLKKLAALVLFIIGATFSLQGAAWAIVAAAAVGVVVNGWAVHRAIGLTLRSQLAGAGSSLFLAGVVGLAVAMAGSAWAPAPVVELLALGAGGLGAYLVLALALRTPVFDVLRTLAGRVPHGHE